MTGREYHGIEVTAREADEDLVAQIATEISSRGVEQRQGPGNHVRYRIFLQDDGRWDATRRLRELWRTHTGSEAARVVRFVEPDQDWGAEARKAFAGTAVDAFWIGPPWVAAPADRLVIRINPGRAFGTGLHASTRVALRLLLTVAPSLRRGLDVGTGSGILAAAAALHRGVERVTALDVDPHALRNAADNMVVNGCADRVDLVAGSVEAVARGNGSFDVILANLEAALLAPLLAPMKEALSLEGVLVVSGVAPQHRLAFSEAAHGAGLAIREEDEEEGWWGAALVRR